MSTDDHGAARDAIGSGATSRRSVSNVRDPIMTPEASEQEALACTAAP